MTATVYYTRRSPAGGINITTDEQNVVSFGSASLGLLAFDLWKEGLAKIDGAILLDDDGTVLVGDVGDLAP
jgi:hypothetical protein